MSEAITQTRAEEAITAANDFLKTERGTSLDGGFASQQMADRIATVSERARALLQAVPFPNREGWYVPLSRHNANSFDEATAVLPGHFVLVPSTAVDSHAPAAFYPAVVSEDGLKTQSLRLHVVQRPYHEQEQIRFGVATTLSAAGQSETKGIGDHDPKRVNNDGIEAEHFPTLLAAGNDAALLARWKAGEHVNHDWRQQSNDSVMTQVSNRLFGSDVPQATITITREQILANRVMLLWHEGMQDPATGKPETATKDNALLVVQGLGFQALKAHNPHGVDAVRRLIA